MGGSKSHGSGKARDYGSGSRSYGGYDQQQYDAQTGYQEQQYGIYVDENGQQYQTYYDENGQVQYVPLSGGQSQYQQSSGSGSSHKKHSSSSKNKGGTHGTTGSSHKKKKKPNVWYCCQCTDGPLSIANHASCVTSSCQHQRCGHCTGDTAVVIES